MTHGIHVKLSGILQLAISRKLLMPAELIIYDTLVPEDE